MAYSVQLFTNMLQPSTAPPHMSRLSSITATSASVEAKSNNFNFLRLLLAIVVIFSHAWPILYGIDHLDPVASALHKQFDQLGDHVIDSGHMAVYGFFVISGYLISMSFVRSRGVVDYLKKRVLRIYPGFLAAVLLCAVLFGPLGALDTHIYWAELLYHPRTLVLKAFNLSVDWNTIPFTNTLTTVPIPRVLDGSLWTVRYEFLCYLMVAVLGIGSTFLSRYVSYRMMRFFPAVFFLVVYALYAGLLHGHFTHWADRLNHFALTPRFFGSLAAVPRLFLYFIAGMCLYAYRQWIPYNTSLLIISICLEIGYN